MQAEKEVPDNSVFWATVGIVSVFVVVLASIAIVKSGFTANIVLQWSNPTRPFEVNPYACMDVPMCGGSNSYMCCAEKALPNGLKCTQPLLGYASEAPMCPDAMPYKCPCPEKYPYRQSWPVPAR